MTHRQRIALAYHCRLAGETAHPRFGRAEPHGMSSVLTVNSGWE